MAPSDEFDTVKMARQGPPKNNKVELLKVWGTILGSLLAFITSITVVVLQQYSVSKADLSKVKTEASDGMNSIQHHTNNVVIPKIVETIIRLRERLAKTETEIENLKELLKETRQELLHPGWHIVPDRIPGMAMLMGAPDIEEADEPEEAFIIPKLKFQQMAQ
jgi:hypothetical protein